MDNTKYLDTTDTSHTSGNLGGRHDDVQYLNDVFVRKYASPEPVTEVTSTVEDVSGPVNPVPELSTILLFSIGLLVLTGYALRKRS